MFKYKPCPQCGDYCDGVGWTGVLEYSYQLEQTCFISCSGCDFDIKITIDPEKGLGNKTREIEQILKETWNKMYELSK